VIGPTIQIARLFGIPIRIDISWILVFVLFVYFVTQDFFEPLFPDVNQGIVVWLAIVTILLFFFSVLLHELAHSLVAITQGLKVKGIALFILGGASQLEGEPRTPWIEFWMALAGPLVNLALGIVCGWLCLAFGGMALARAVLGQDVLYKPVSPAVAVLFWLSLQNILLFLFNIIPGFPMDGGRAVRALIWGVSHNYGLATRIAAWLGRGIGYLFLGLGVFLLFDGSLTGLWLLLLGFFLLNAARAGLGQAALREAFEGYEVRQFVQPNPLVVPGQLAVELLVQEYYGRYNASLYPVRLGDDIAGVVTRTLVQRASKKNWERTRVSEIMAPLSPEYVVGPHTPAQDAFNRMAANSAGSLLVMEGSTLLGVVSQGEMLRMLRVLSLMKRSRPHSPPESTVWPPLPAMPDPPGPLPPPEPPASSASDSSLPGPSDPSDHYEHFGA
jgi:Zn-dependent protease